MWHRVSRGVAPANVETKYDSTEGTRVLLMEGRVEEPASKHKKLPLGRSIWKVQ